MISRLRCLTKNRTVLSNVLRLDQLNAKCSTKIESVESNNAQVNEDEDMPIDIQNPYLEEKPCCILCRYKVEVNYKNTRLLSQFISSYTGLLYERNITGLCARQHQAVRHQIKVAQFLNLMPRFFKDPRFKNDPKLFNPFKPLRENNT